MFRRSLPARRAASMGGGSRRADRTARSRSPFPRPAARQPIRHRRCPARTRGFLYGRLTGLKAERAENRRRSECSHVYGLLTRPDDRWPGCAPRTTSKHLHTRTSIAACSQSGVSGRGRMKAHIVGGGFGGLAAAALLIRNAGMSGPDITVYEADEKLGGGFFLAGDAKSGYNLPGSIFDREFRCALDLLGKIPTRAYSNINVAEQFLTFNKEHPFVDQTHIIDRNLRRVHDQRYGLNLGDGLRLAKLSLTREASLDGQLIKDWFSPRFFATEFWLLWSTLMGSLPQHTIIEFRRYLNRFVYLFPDLSTMANVLRSQFNQHEAFVEPLVTWLERQQVNVLKGAFVSDIEFTESPGRMAPCVRAVAAWIGSRTQGAQEVGSGPIRTGL
ncbi:MAG: oleate hydratase [Candidatus Acidiferrales bacterium]